MDGGDRRKAMRMCLMPLTVVRTQVYVTAVLPQQTHKQTKCQTSTFCGTRCSKWTEELAKRRANDHIQAAVFLTRHSVRVLSVESRLLSGPDGVLSARPSHGHLWPRRLTLNSVSSVRPCVPPPSLASSSLTPGRHSRALRFPRWPPRVLRHVWLTVSWVSLPSPAEWPLEGT